MNVQEADREELICHSFEEMVVIFLPVRSQMSAFNFPAIGAVASNTITIFSVAGFGKAEVDPDDSG